MSKPEQHLQELYLKSKGFVKEYRFNPSRRWRFDYALLKHKVAIEIEGGVWIRGRHSRGKGMVADMQKYNWATVNGWKVLRYVPQELINIVKDMEVLLK